MAKMSYNRNKNFDRELFIKGILKQIMKKNIKKTNRKFLTRVEMWKAITDRYPSLKVFSISGVWKKWGTYRTRSDLVLMILDMKIHKSKHLTKEQKGKLNYEIEMTKLNKSINQL